MKEIASRLNEFKDSIFGVISALARDYDAVNLGQGFPDFDAPEFLKKIAEQKIHEGHNQYAPFHGTSNLRAEISSYYDRFYGLKYDTEKEISVRSEEHTSELQSRPHLVCRLLLEKKKKETLQYI